MHIATFERVGKPMVLSHVYLSAGCMLEMAQTPTPLCPAAQCKTGWAAASTGNQPVALCVSPKTA